ncbi:uncharacterized protein LOC106177497 [Lingula anatina]|uniref:Uncharacterized protein LOC106177497 n=1 Tax=Lingula anatina TaxID=7574 RepID=A0A1S3K052_LINAN|nr:uncharacterized protein LOC106177497 [Lingula anatina]|eukprot:XP_013415739.1 uncharacterized protein LOC106177497 [Lingula anatina]
MDCRGSKGDKKKASDRQYQNPTNPITGEMTHQSGRMEPDHRGSQSHGFNERSPGYVAGTRGYGHRHTSAHYQSHYDEEEVMDHDGDTKHHGGSRRDFMQAQRQQFRSLQASKQMLYDVYEQNMGMIEELEARDSTEMSQNTGGFMPYIRSKISLPTQKHKARTDVTAIIEAEIVCLQTQLMVAPKEVVASATEELIKKTLLWLAHRQDMAAPLAHCDGYAVNVLELLLHGNAEIQRREKGPNAGRLDEDTVNGVMGGFQGAKHKQKLQDEEFRRDEKKQPKLSDIRGGKSLLSGVRRVLAMKPNLEPYLSPFVNTEDLR